MQGVGLPSVVSPLVDVNRYVTSPWRAFFVGLVSWINYLNGQLGGLSTFQTGDTKTFAGTVAPDGWLACDGAAVDRDDYADLFTAIGVTWGPGDGSTTFNLPDFRGRFLIGMNGSLPVGSYGGADAVTLTTTELPSHTHTINDPGHVHATVGASVAAQIGVGTTGVLTPATTVSATTGITVNATGTGDPFSILPPYAAVMTLIKT